MNDKFDKSLKKVPFYKLHPSYLPFVGANYDQYKILHIGESHYCDTMKVEEYNIDYFSKWFDSPCNEIEAVLLNHNITRDVVNGVVNNKCHFNIFDNVLRSFIHVMENVAEPHISEQMRHKYDYFAFMNFFPFPAFKAKGSFLKSILSFANDHNCNYKAKQLINRAEQEATIIVDQVIDILQPNCIVFTSCDAWKSYKQNQGKYVDDKRMIYTSHPGQPLSWCRKLSSLGNQRGIDVFEDGLKKIYNK